MDDDVRAGLPVRLRGRDLTLTLRGGVLLGVALVALSVAYLTDWPELLIVAVFCGLPPILALVLVVALRPILTVGRRVTPSTLMVGGSGSATLLVRNRSRGIALPTRWSDQLPWPPRHTGFEQLGAMTPGGSTTLRYIFEPPMRGILQLGPLQTEVSDPFGFARARFTLGDEERIVVSPPSVALVDGSVDPASSSGSAPLFDHHALAGEHDVMTRDYRPGDALRRVHWKASAHHGELMVREDEKRSHSESVILVDTRRHSYRDVAAGAAANQPESARFEWALSMVASLRDHWADARLRVVVVETATAQLADASQPEAFVESLARVRLSYHDASSMCFARDQQERLGTLLAILDDPDAQTVAVLLDQCSRFATTAVLFLAPPRDGLAAHLANAGCTVLTVREGEGVAQAWARLCDLSARKRS